MALILNVLRLGRLSTLTHRWSTNYIQTSLYSCTPVVTTVNEPQSTGSELKPEPDYFAFLNNPPTRKMHPFGHPGLLLADWRLAHETYFGPERDTENFPLIQIHSDTRPKTHFLVIPDFLFDFFYPKTGVSGPYIFLVGFMTTLMSKEYIIHEENFRLCGPFLMACWLGLKMCKYIKLDIFEDRTVFEYVDYMYERWAYEEHELPLRLIKEHYTFLRDHCEREIQRIGLQTLINEALRENVALQLEDAFRLRLAHVHREVKLLMDYHVDKDLTMKRLEVAHLLTWVENEVLLNITDQQEKGIEKCIQDLEDLAKRQQEAPAI